MVEIKTRKCYNVFVMIKTRFYQYIKEENTMDKKVKSCGGRPAGRVKTAKIEITIEPEIKVEFMEILRTEGKKMRALR